jgi:Protein of unknown function (DUF1525)
MQNPLLVEVIAYAPTAFYHCTHCEVAFREMGATNYAQEEQISSSLPEDLTNEYQQLSDWVREIFRQYGDRVVVRVVDAASIEGLIKSVRYGVRRYPALIVNHNERFSGGAYEDASREIAQRLSSEELVRV